MLFLEPTFLLALLAGVLGLDATAILQTLISRPLVAGGLAGWILGDLGTGLAIGSLVELLWMGGVPIGSLVPPDGTIAAVFAAAVAVLMPQAVPGTDALVASSLALLVAVPAGYLGAKGEIVQRRISDSLSRNVDEDILALRWQGLTQAITRGLLLAFGRSFLVALFVLGAGLPAVKLLIENLPADATRALHWAYWLAWLLGLAVGANFFWERRSLKYLGLMVVATAITGSRPGVSQGQLLALVLSVALLGGLWRWRRAWLQSQEGEF